MQIRKCLQYFLLNIQEKISTYAHVKIDGFSTRFCMQLCTTANLICFARDLYVTHALLPFKEGYTLPLIAVYVPLGVIVACGKFISINVSSDHLVNHIVFL
jgi:hypothetical protein